MFAEKQGACHFHYIFNLFLTYEYVIYTHSGYFMRLINLEIHVHSGLFILNMRETFLYLPESKIQRNKQTNINSQVFKIL